MRKKGEGENFVAREVEVSIDKWGSEERIEHNHAQAAISVEGCEKGHSHPKLNVTFEDRPDMKINFMDTTEEVTNLLRVLLQDFRSKSGDSSSTPGDSE